MVEQGQEASPQGEQEEDQALAQILQICQSAQDPSGYQQIAQIVQGLIQHNQQEEGGMGGQDGGEQSIQDKVMSRIEANRGQKGA